MHRLIARRLMRNPALVDVALMNLNRWQGLSNDCPANEWECYLKGSLKKLLRIMTSLSEQAIRMRQSSPFAGDGFISDEERKRVIAKYK